nr:alkaline phosphatase D family protein [uncultured Albidiferax sp.]
MSIKVAFTSCSDPLDAPVQPVWDTIAELTPDHLVLLGDQIYMDYGVLTVKSENPPLGKPAKFPNLQFAAAMHERYQRQWSIFRASKLAALPNLKIHGIWDDHDFAWNNSFGDNGSNNTHLPASKHDPVSRDKQQIARRLMRDYFTAIRSSSDTYPSNPFDSDVIPHAEDLAEPMYCADPAGSASVQLGPNEKLLLTDGRSFRTKGANSQTTALGAAQLAWMDQEFNATDTILLASSTTLTQGGIPLNMYGDYEKLIAQAATHKAKVICLTGDVHTVDFRHHGPWVFEVVASGAARLTSEGLLHNRLTMVGAFGIVHIHDNEVVVNLHVASSNPAISRSINRSTWSEK